MLVTSGTVTSANLARDRFPPDVIHQFIPLDTPRFVAQFLNHWQPTSRLFTESDIWPNLIMAARKRRIPLIIVNGRVSERSFQRWRALHGTAKALLGRFDLCLAQSGLDANRFTQLGAPQVEVTGNLKLDVPAPPIDDDKLQGAERRHRRSSGGRRDLDPSGRGGCRDRGASPAARSRFRGLLTIIVPRHPERGRDIYNLAERAGQVPALRSQRQLPDRHTADLRRRHHGRTRA